MTALRAGRAENVEPVVLCLANGCEPFSTFTPAACQRALLTESGLILKVRLYSFVGMIGGNLSQRLRELFLKASWVCESDFSCRGRGARYEHPIR